MSPVWFVWTLFWAYVLLYAVGKFALMNRTNLAITCLLMRTLLRSANATEG